MLMSMGLDGLRDAQSIHILIVVGRAPPDIVFDRRAEPDLHWRVKIFSRNPSKHHRIMDYAPIRATAHRLNRCEHLPIMVKFRVVTGK